MNTSAPTDQTIASDVAAIGVIDAIPKLLEVVCRSTGMGFAAGSVRGARRDQLRTGGRR
jgi:hypothetical protein